MYRSFENDLIDFQPPECLNPGGSFFSVAPGDALASGKVPVMTIVERPGFVAFRDAMLVDGTGQFLIEHKHAYLRGEMLARMSIFARLIKRAAPYRRGKRAS